MSVKSMPVWKWVLLLIVSLFLAINMYGIAQLAGDFIKNAWLRCIVNVAVSGAMIALYALFVRWFEKEPARDLPLKGLIKDTSKGLGVGAGFFVAVVSIMLAAGLYRITNCGTDQATGIITAFFAFLMVAVGEEIVFRGIMFRWIDEKWGFAAALIISSLLFGVMHIFQPNATWWSSLAIAIEAGLLLGAAYKWSGTLWFPIGIHWAWNFFEGNIFGFAVSGSDPGKSLITSAVTGPDILTGGPFGAEASIITVILGTILSVWFIVRAARK